MPWRSARALRERYVNYLDPEVCHDQWTKYEDEILIKLYQVYSTQWSKIAANLPGRTDIAVKNRYAKLKRKINSPEPEEERNDRIVLPSITLLPFDIEIPLLFQTIQN